MSRLSLYLAMAVLALTGAASTADAAPALRRIRDCSDCPQMVGLPGGVFAMGAPEADKTDADERPQHEVTVAAFAIGKYEVTRAEYEAFVKDTGRPLVENCHVWIPSSWQRKTTATWRSPGFLQTPRDPVVCVSWEDANAYAAWLSHKTGQSYRLPTEAEWEYAARAGTKTWFYWGEKNEEACRYANAADLVYAEVWPKQKHGLCSDGHLYTSPVGSFRPNPFGLFDMLGNTYEWVQDCYAPYGDQPRDGSAYVGGACTERVLRGGSWHNGPGPGHDIRVSNRNHTEPDELTHDHGFRLARTIKP